jgi:hypothetical protein
VVRITDVGVLKASMERVAGMVRSKGEVAGSGTIYLLNHTTDTALMTLRYRLKDSSFEAAEAPFEAGGQKFSRGSFIVKNVSSEDFTRAIDELGLRAVAASTAPTVKTHAIKVPRIAVMHTWLGTQSEGWWRMAFDSLKIP